MWTEDGHAARIHDLWYDDRSFVLQRLVVDGEGDLDGLRAVLPFAVLDVSHEDGVLRLSLKVDALREASDSRRAHTVRHSAHLPRRAPRNVRTNSAKSVPAADARPRSMPQPHPRQLAVRRTIGYGLRDSEGRRFGAVADAVIDLGGACLPFLVVRTRRYVRGRRVLQPTGEVRGIDRSEGDVLLNTSKKQVDLQDDIGREQDWQQHLEGGDADVRNRG